MTNITIWQMESSAMWYSRLGRRVWTALEVTFGAWPVTPGHQAGVVWTTDGWRTANWTAAVWQRNVANPYGDYDEVWKVRMFDTSLDPVRFWYALYVEDAQGVRYWDSNQGWNYERIV
jgi:hypothetical protein